MIFGNYPQRPGNTNQIFMRRERFVVLINWILVAVIVSTLAAESLALAQTSGAAGAVRGTVTLEDTNQPVHGVLVTILQLRRSVMTGDDGAYEFQSVPAGRYELVAHLDRVPDVVRTVEVSAGSTVEAGFQIRLRPAEMTVTVTATGEEETSLNAIQPVNTLSSTELAEKNVQSLGEALDRELGISKRSFGPATSRPVVRGFDGDRVLVLEDGNRIGALGFQSGDHAEPIDVLNLEKLEVVKGPATLLYGSSAIGGVVNAITGHESAHPGTHGYITGFAGTNDYHSGGSAGVEHGTENWLFWANGGGQRAGDYDTPIGRITNSYSRAGNGSGGLGYYPKHGSFSLDYAFDKRKYGIPFNPDEPEAEVVFLNPRRHSVRLNGALRDRDDLPFRGAEVSLQYNDYRHGENDAFTEEVNTLFKNKTFSYQAVFDQQKKGPWSGSFGFWGLERDYSASGEEALAPPTLQNAFAVFVLEKLDYERATFQVGGRYEHNTYDPTSLPDRPTPGRTFNGFSGAAGLRVSLWKNGAFAANYTHSHRAPALEELYNNGPHPGNATFEIGDPNLERERGDGIDLSLRHASGRIRAELNYFFYRIKDFIFLAPTGNIEEGLIEANYAQGKSRYTGAEARLEVGLHRNLWWISKVDYVNAELTETETPLPRIPPLRGIIGLEAKFKGLRLYPELVMADHQTRLFPTETSTAGYAVFNLTASYTVTQEHIAHTFSVNTFNLGDVLYRNHLSFIKEFAPEIGRGVRFTYTARFY
jgi:iron complex outermembrane recepter protein